MPKSPVASAKPTSHARPVPCRRTIPEILSVMEVYVCAARRTGGGASGRRAGSAVMSAELRVPVGERGEVRRPRLRVELPEERVVPRLGLEDADAAPWVVQVA